MRPSGFSRCGGTDGQELNLPGEGCPSKLASLSSWVMRPAGGWLAAGTAETGFCVLLDASAVLNMVLINKHCTCHLVI